MIAANELRIGNWINYLDINGLNPSQIEIDDFINLKEDGEKDFAFSPIPLTPEILEKCGFEWSIYHQAWHKQGFVFDLSERSVGGFFMHKSRLNSEIICPEIQHLHQLQNLYFSLTNSELNYTP